MLIVTFLLVLAPLSVSHAAAQREEGPYDDGCYYVRTGNALTLARCPQSDGSDYYYEPDGRGGWPLVMQCATTAAFRACLGATGLYIESYPDGSSYLENSNRIYAINHVDGTVAEYGFYNRSGQQMSDWYSGKNSLAMRNRSLTYWAVHNNAVQTVVYSNPTAFDGLMTVNYGNNYMNCLHLNDSRTDFDNNGRTGFNELASYCAQ